MVIRVEKIIFSKVGVDLVKYCFLWNLGYLANVRYRPIEFGFVSGSLVFPARENFCVLPFLIVFAVPNGCSGMEELSNGSGPTVLSWITTRCQNGRVLNTK